MIGYTRVVLHFHCMGQLSAHNIYSKWNTSNNADINIIEMPQNPLLQTWQQIKHKKYSVNIVDTLTWIRDDILTRDWY